MSKSLLPGELMEFFTDNRQTLNKDALCIAEDSLTGMEIWLTEKGGYPYFSVGCDEVIIHESECVSGADAIDTYRDLLNLYIDDTEDEDNVTVVVEEDEEEESLLTDDQEVRSDRIIMAVWDMLDVMTDNSTEELGIFPEDMTKLAYIIEQAVYDNYGIAIQHHVVMACFSTSSG